MTRPYVPQPVARDPDKLQGPILREMDRTLKNHEERLDGIPVSGALIAHAPQHENGGSDEISVAGLSGLLGTAQTPTAHAASHQDGGSDEVSVTGLAGLLATAQTPIAHATSHQSGGSDAIKLDDLSATDDNTDLNASTTKHGLMMKYPGGTTTFLRADASFATPAGGSSETADNVFRVIGSADATKKLALEVDGFTTATTRTLTPQNASYILAGTNIANVFSTVQQVAGPDYSVTLDPDNPYTFLVDGYGTTIFRVDTDGQVVDMLAMQLWPTGVGSGYSAAFQINTLTDNTAYRFPALSGSMVVVGDDPSPVGVGNLGRENLTAQAAVIPSTNLSNSPPSGFYVIYYEMSCTTGDVTAGTMAFNVTLVGELGSQTISSTALPLTTATPSAGNPVRGTLPRYLASGNIAYSTSMVTGAVNSARYALRIRVEFLGG